MNIYQTTTMLAAIKKMFPVRTFFRDRYFETSAEDIFPTTEVLVEYRKGTKKLAPFVVPRRGGIEMEREGYTAYTYTPAYIAPERSLTIDFLEQKQFGETLYSDQTPEQRQQNVLATDLAELSEMIDRREEWMASQLLQFGEIVMKHYGSSPDKKNEKYQEKVLRFYDKSTGFSNEFIPNHTWDDPASDKYEDLDAMVYMITDSGNMAADLCMGSMAATAFLKDKTIQELLNNRRIEIGNIKPTVTPQGVGHLGQIVVRGRILNIFIYDESYEDENGKNVPFFPPNKILITAPNMGRFLYGAISQIEQTDYVLHTYRAKRVPKYLANATDDVRKIRVASAPIALPKDAGAWSVATVLEM